MSIVRKSTRTHEQPYRQLHSECALPLSLGPLCARNRSGYVLLPKLAQQTWRSAKRRSLKPIQGLGHNNHPALGRAIENAQSSGDCQASGARHDSRSSFVQQHERGVDGVRQSNGFPLTGTELKHVEAGPGESERLLEPQAIRERLNTIPPPVEELPVNSVLGERRLESGLDRRGREGRAEAR